MVFIFLNVLRPGWVGRHPWVGQGPRPQVPRLHRLHLHFRRLYPHHGTGNKNHLKDRVDLSTLLSQTNPLPVYISLSHKHSLSLSLSFLSLTHSANLLFYIFLIYLLLSINLFPLSNPSLPISSPLRRMKCSTMRLTRTRRWTSTSRGTASASPGPTPPWTDWTTPPWTSLTTPLLTGSTTPPWTGWPPTCWTDWTLTGWRLFHGPPSVSSLMHNAKATTTDSFPSVHLFMKHYCKCTILLCAMSSRPFQNFLKLMLFYRLHDGLRAHDPGCPGIRSTKSGRAAAAPARLRKRARSERGNAHRRCRRTPANV